MTIHNASRTRREQAPVTMMTFTTHVVDVDLEPLLREIDVTDGGEVIVALQMPSGRAKRVRIPASSLVHREW